MKASYETILEIWQKTELTLGICWSDKKEQEIDVVNLRFKCPCALCVDEITGLRKNKSYDFFKHVRPKSLTSVGQYAISVEFDDGHKTGIYSYDFLRNSL